MHRFVALLAVLCLVGCSGDDNGGDDGGGNGGGGTGNTAVIAAAARTGAFGYRVTIGQPASPKPGTGSGGPVALDAEDLEHLEALLFPKIEYGFSFSLRANGTLSDGDTVDVAEGLNGGTQFKVMLEGQGGQNHIRFAARMDDGTIVEQGSSTPFPSGYNLINARWSAPGEYLRTSLNGTPTPELSSLDNTNQQVERLRIGVIGGSVDPATNVSLDFDDIAEEFIAQFSPLTVTEGLDPGDSLTFTQLDQFFFCTNPFCSDGTGGSFGGGTISQSGSAVFDVTGTGALSGYSRTLFLPYSLIVDTAQPSSTTGSVVNISNNIEDMVMSLLGDPDFASLEFRSGSVQGLTSPGSTTLTRLSGGNFEVDSFFDIAYEIEFTGAPGGPLDGFGNVDPDTEFDTLTFDKEPSGLNQIIFADGFESGDTSAWTE